MKIIYICSPYHAGSEKILKRNIEYAKKLTREILLRGDAWCMNYSRKWRDRHEEN